MKKTLNLFLMMIVITLNACAPQMTGTLDQPSVMTEAPQSLATEAPAVKSYMNRQFGFGFQFPSSWFGPEEYISGQDLRVEVGSDKVYPYGTDPAERTYETSNSYNVVIQYSKSDQSDRLADPTYQSLLNIKDGESLSDARSLLIRVRQLEIGRFKGFEYITTLSETGQTDHFYIRSVMLFDEQSKNVLTLMGQPINVEVSDGAEWRNVYRTIDEANLTAFHQIVDSITLNSTGMLELDKIIDVVLQDNTDELKSLIKLTQVKCTFAEGLGGPPKCLEGEQEGNVVEVLPVMASEGYFVRKADLETWEGLDVTALFAAYEVSGAVYSDENYPAGDYAIVFINRDKQTSLTLQIDQGNIIRIDYGFEYPPSIPAGSVVRYLIEPIEANT